MHRTTGGRGRGRGRRDGDARVPVTAMTDARRARRPPPMRATGELVVKVANPGAPASEFRADVEQQMRLLGKNIPIISVRCPTPLSL